MKSLVRWLIFLLVGLPFQGLVYVLYPFIWLYWRLVIYKEPGDKIVAYHEHVPSNLGTYFTSYDVLFNDDNHGALSMYGALGKSGMENLIDPKGNPTRRINMDGSLDMDEVSGDVVISWAFAYTAPNMENKPDDALMSLAWAYLKNLGTLSYDAKNNGDVSNRCNNFGINYCPDSDTLRLGQPAAGPQFYTSSAVFALASQKSLFFKVVFWTHWLLMGGWYWAFAPMVYPDMESWWYVRDMSMKALYVHKYVFGNRWWIKKPMEFITYETCTHRNDLFYAMLGFDPLIPLPLSMNCFFSQEADATSRLGSRMNGYLGGAIMNLAKQARELNKQ